MEQFSNVVSLEYRVGKAFEGRYFMGHTPTLTLQPRVNGWVALYNPRGSGVNVFVNTFTVSNFSAVPFRAQLWLNALPDNGEVSPYSSATNAAFQPAIWPEAAIVFGQEAGPLQGGQSLFTRVAGAQSTTVGNYYGKIILPPNGSLLLQLQASMSQSIQAEAAFGWWEDLI